MSDVCSMLAVRRYAKLYPDDRAVSVLLGPYVCFIVLSCILSVLTVSWKIQHLCLAFKSRRADLYENVVESDKDTQPEKKLVRLQFSAKKIYGGAMLAIFEDLPLTILAIL